MWNWFRSIAGRTRSAAADALRGRAHLTFGQTSVGRSISRTGTLLKKQLWIWPIIAFVVLATIGYFIKTSIQHTMEENLATQLTTIRDLERSMLEKWFLVQENNATALANDPEIRNQIVTIVDGPSAQTEANPEPQQSSASVRLHNLLQAGSQAHQFVGYVVLNREFKVIAAKTEGLIGESLPEHEEFLAKVVEGEPSVSTPFISLVPLKDQDGKLRAGLPTMFACVPVRNSDFAVIAILAMRIRPEREFTEIMQLGKFGATGETYAFDKRGVLISNSRFDPELRNLRLIPNRDDAHSILNVQIRDPGGDLTRGFRTPAGKRLEEFEFTSAAKAALSGNTGYSLAGSRDYRGVPSVAAWTWLPKYEVGIVTKVDYDEAFRPLTILQRVFFSLFALLIIAAIAIFVFTLIVSRLQRDAQKAEIEARLLGQYRLENQIGAGGMGVVYRAQHAMMRRPTAVKMLEVEKASEAAVQRFEREVQLTCQLNNPHTVAIYDYGRTPEGVFYYAMEYLDGINLQSLVEKYGAQPEGRVIEILKQVCGSLFEAHTLGLVHRDIKPANIMLNRRGGEPDVVKVLDFGLVKSLTERSSEAGGRNISGTPLYMSPEAIQSPDLIDARSDLYAVGAVGYYLLTGQTVFDARSLTELCQMHVEAVPETPSKRLNRTVCADLEHAILSCLEKSRAKRPQTARDLANMLAKIVPQQSWTQTEAEAWWSRHERQQNAASLPTSNDSGQTRPPPSAPAGGTLVAGLERTIMLDGNGNPS